MFGMQTVPYYPNPEEMQLLEWLYEEKTINEIAKQLGITKGAVHTKLCRLRQRTNCKTQDSMMYRYGIHKERNKEKEGNNEK